MEVEFITENNSQDWDDFVYHSDSGWFRHTTFWQKYSSCCRFDSNTKNFSFLVKQNNQIQAVVPLLAEYSYSDKTFDCFCMYGDYTPLPAYVNKTDIDKAKVNDCIKNEICRIAKENNIKYGKFIIDPLIKHNYFNDFECFNLLGSGAKLNFSTTNIVDLTLDDEVILRKMRKGHKAAIKAVAKETGYHTEIYDKNNITKEKILKFKEIHKIDAGRQTRTDESCLLNGHCGYIIQYDVIKYLKRSGYEKYETGDNYYKEIRDDNDLKLHQIAKYKRGFRSLEYPKITYYQLYEKEL